MHIKDLDVENRRSWQGALDMIFTLCGEAADLSFDCRMLGSRNKLPTVEFRLDAPAELTLPPCGKHGRRHGGSMEIRNCDSDRPHTGSSAGGDNGIPAAARWCGGGNIPGIQGERAGADRAEAAGRIFMEPLFSWRLCAMTYPLRLQERPQHMPMELCTLFGCAAPMMRR